MANERATPEALTHARIDELIAEHGLATNNPTLNRARGLVQAVSAALASRPPSEPTPQPRAVLVGKPDPCAFCESTDTSWRVHCHACGLDAVPITSFAGVAAQEAPPAPTMSMFASREDYERAREAGEAQPAAAQEPPIDWHAHGMSWALADAMAPS